MQCEEEKLIPFSFNIHEWLISPEPIAIRPLNQLRSSFEAGADRLGIRRELACSISSIEQLVIQLSVTGQLLRDQQLKVLSIATDSLVSSIHQLFTWLRDVHERELSLMASEAAQRAPTDQAESGNLFNKFLSFLTPTSPSRADYDPPEVQVSMPILLELFPNDPQESVRTSADMELLRHVDLKQLIRARTHLQHRAMYLISILKCLPMSSSMATLPPALLTNPQLDLQKALQLVGDR